MRTVMSLSDRSGWKLWRKICESRVRGMENKLQKNLFLLNQRTHKNLHEIPADFALQCLTGLKNLFIMRNLD